MTRVNMCKSRHKRLQVSPVQIAHIGTFHSLTLHAFKTAQSLGKSEDEGV